MSRFPLPSPTVATKTSSVTLSSFSVRQTRRFLLGLRPLFTRTPSETAVVVAPVVRVDVGEVGAVLAGTTDLPAVVAVAVMEVVVEMAAAEEDGGKSKSVAPPRSQQVHVCGRVLSLGLGQAGRDQCP